MPSTHGTKMPLHDLPILKNVAGDCAKSHSFAGFDYLTLLEIVVQVASYVIECYKSKHAAETPQQYVEKHYIDGEYSSVLLASTVRRVHAGARSKDKKLSREQARELAIKSLDSVRLGSKADVEAAISSYESL